MESTRTKRRDGRLPQTGFRPKPEDFAKEYLNGPILAHEEIRTQNNEHQAIRRWTEHLGGVRREKITAPLIQGFRERNLAQARSARTVNLDTVALRNVLKLARERG